MIALAMFVCASAVFLGFPKKLIGMYLAEGTAGADAAATLTYSLDYLYVMLWGLLPFAVSQVYASTLREVGETRLPMFASVVAILVNLVFQLLPDLRQVRLSGAGRDGRGHSQRCFPAMSKRRLSSSIRMPSRAVFRSCSVLIANCACRCRCSKTCLCAVCRCWSMNSCGRWAWQFCCNAILSEDWMFVAASNIASTVSNLFKVVFLSMGNAVAIMVGQALWRG